MSKQKHNQRGFIPMMIAIIVVVITILYFTFVQVAKAQH